MRRRIFYVLFTIILTLLLLIGSAKILKRKYSDNEYGRFYKYSNEFEVLFFGPSVVHYAVSPMQLWNDYGITSYNMANDSERLTMTYYNIINSLDYCKPKVVVVDLASMCWAGTTRDYTLKDHNFLDAVPFSLNKIKEVKDIFEKDEYVEYLVPFSIYHSRWNDLTKEDFVFDSNSVLYGMKIEGNVFHAMAPTREQYEESRFGNVEFESNVIDDIIELCEENDIDLIFTYLPNSRRGGDQMLREYCCEYLSSKDAVFLDLLYMESFDYNRDTTDGTHVNIFGAQKITDYLGQYLSTNYNLCDYRKNQEYVERWSTDYQLYEDVIEEITEDNKDDYFVNGNGQ